MKHCDMLSLLRDFLCFEVLLEPGYSNPGILQVCVRFPGVVLARTTHPIDAVVNCVIHNPLANDLVHLELLLCYSALYALSAVA